MYSVVTVLLGLLAMHATGAFYRLAIKPPRHASESLRHIRTARADGPLPRTRPSDWTGLTSSLPPGPNTASRLGTGGRCVVARWDRNVGARRHHVNDHE